MLLCCPAYVCLIVRLAPADGHACSARAVGAGQVPNHKAGLDVDVRLGERMKRESEMPSDLTSVPASVP